jgi:hypothetical protein
MSQEHLSNDLLVLDQQKRQHSIYSRLIAANEHDMFSDFKSNTDWKVKYNNALDLSEVRSRVYGICDHSAEHIMRVAANALYLADVAISAANESESRLDSRSDWKSVMSAHNLLYAAKLHDVGYGDPDAQVDVGSRSIPGHEQLGLKMITEYSLMPTDTSSSTHRYVHDRYNLLSSAIAINLQQATQLAVQLIAQEDPVIPEQLLPVIIKAADMGDLFFRGRVDFLSDEVNTGNTYLDLSYAATQNGMYTGTKDNTLTFAVALDAYPIRRRNSSLVDKFGRWYRDTQNTTYSGVWELGKSLASIVGKSFQVSGIENNMAREPGVLATLGSNAIVHS